MAVNDSNGTPTPSFTSGFGSTSAAAPAAQVNDSYSDLSNWTLSDPAETGPVSANMGSEDLIALTEKIKKKFEDKSNGFEAFVLLADKQTTNYFASISVVLIHKSNPTKGAYHTFVLEASNAEIADQTESFAGDTYKVKLTPDVVYNEEFDSNVQAFLNSALPQYQLVAAGATMVPRIFKHTDDVLVHKLAHTASQATSTALEQTSPSFRDFSLVRAKGDTNLVVNVRTEQITRENAVGLPVRSDIQVEFTTEAARRPDARDSWNSGKRQSQVFGFTSGFVDAVWAPVQPQSQGSWGVQQQLQTQCFAPRVVITDVNPVKLGTLGAVLTLINATTTSLSTNDLWVNAFRRDPAKLAQNARNGAIDWKDIGALNIEANLERQGEFGKRVITDPTTLTDELFRKYISSVMQQSAVFSIDLPALSPQSWAMDLLRSAIEGKASGINAVIQSANDLTEGEFSKLYNGGPLFVETDNIIHMGYYEGADGKLHDIRDIDHLAVLNHLGERDGNIGRIWSDTFYDTSKPLAKRLAKRVEVIEAIVPSVKFTGLANRATFASDFLISLAKACFNAGLRTRLNAPASNLGLQTSRATAGFVNQAGFGGQGNVFNQPGVSSFNNGSNVYSNIFNSRG